MSKKTLYAILDTETVNSFLDEGGKLDLSNSLVYDIAVAIIDKKGRVYDERRFICDEIFHSSLMCTAYYAEKIPQYIDSINAGELEVVPFKEIFFRVRDFLKLYKVKAVMAHNARFDVRALNNTLRYLTGSARRYFFPYGLEIWDTQKMAHDTICQQKAYKKWCKDNGYMTAHKTPRPRETAEVLYRYISGDYEFVERHTGYEDIMIEKEIFAHCLRQHKKMRRLLY